MSFDNSIIGFTSDGRIVYDFDLMVKEYQKDTDTSIDDAVDYISYNNSLPVLQYIQLLLQNKASYHMTFCFLLKYRFVCLLFCFKSFCKARSICVLWERLSARL